MDANLNLKLIWVLKNLFIGRMIFMPLKGTFDLRKFESEVEKVRDVSHMPYLEYTIGEGETLDELFDELVTSPALHGNRSIEGTFKGVRGYNTDLKGKKDLKGKTLYLDIDWLTNSKGIPKEVENAIDKANRKTDELMGSGR